MLNKRSSKIILFLIIPILIAAVSFFYNFAGYLFSPGPLTLGHKEFDNSCFKCHMPLISVSTSCLSCHEVIKKDIEDKTGFHGMMNETDVKKCLRCHTDHKGPDKLIIKDMRSPEQFSKDLNSIREKNHLPKTPEMETIKANYAEMWDKISDKNSWEIRFKEIQENFDHRLTGYPLIGKHAKVKCQDCHKKAKDFKETEKEGLLPSFSLQKVLTKDFCYSCHKKDDDSKKGHKGKYGKNCASCHVIEASKKGWRALVPKVRDFHSNPKHKLIGHHKKTKCQRCHKTADFKKKDEEKKCVYCHEKLDKKYHEQTLGKKCESCHTPESFRKSTFDHQKTKFPLNGAHKKTNCQKCHPQWDSAKQKKKIYKEIKSYTCFDCHASDDIHHGSFPRDCASCHKETYWGDVTQK